MTILSKKEMSEEDIILQYITPAILAKWDKNKITMETKITDGKICLNGNFVHRDKKSAKFADYVLYWNSSFPIAIVEAKDNNPMVGATVACEVAVEEAMKG
jgi:type I restriction enzyme R subunit